MKKLLFLLTCLVSYLLLSQPVSALGHRPAIHPVRVRVRPLMQYVVAVLHLPEARARVVRQALRTQPLRARTPEQLADCLAAVLTPTEYARLQQLEDQVDTYESLRFLASR